MVNLKRTIILGLALNLSVIILFSICAQSQPMRMTIEERVKVLKDSLNLTETQSSEITKILEDQRKEMMKLREENRNKREATRKIMEETSEKTDQKIKATLNKTQVKKYEEMNKRRRDLMEKRFKDSGK